MKNMKLIVILVVIMAFCIAGFYLLPKFSKPQNVSKYPSPPMFTIAPTQSPTITKSNTAPSTMQTSKCTQDLLQATINEQAGAGNIYGTLELINTGKTSCTVTLGNTITEITSAKNITINYEQKTPTETFLLAPGAKVYSQVHYPNGPQCQSGVSPKPISFLYKSGETSVTFQSITPHQETITIQACTSPSENTVVDIWPLSKSPITP